MPARSRILRTALPAMMPVPGAAGISRSALIVIAGGGPAAVQAKNNALLQAVAANPQRYFAIASVHPADGDAALAELDRLAAQGVRFIKLHPNSQEFDVADPAVARIAAHCGKLGMTVLFDSYDPFDPGQIGKFLKLTMSQPGTRFILAHMGYVRFRETMVWSLLRSVAPRATSGSICRPSRPSMPTPRWRRNWWPPCARSAWTG